MGTKYGPFISLHVRAGGNFEKMRIQEKCDSRVLGSKVYSLGSVGMSMELPKP